MHQKTKRGADPGSLNTGRPVAMGVNGAVASPHYLASQVGLDLLGNGARHALANPPGNLTQAM